jgi:nucleoside-diphosphate-sugar epimerase
MRRLLLTGAEGYIGTVLGRRLLEWGYETRGLDARFYEGCDLYAPGAGPEVEEKDTRLAALGDLTGADAVIHLAELSNDPLGDLSPDLTHGINVEATVRLAELAREAGVKRWIQFSSCSVYGCGGAAAKTEQCEVSPLTAYARAKARTEADLRALESAGFAPVLLRHATVFGASPRMRLDLVANQFAAMALVRGRLELTSDGTPVRPLVHVEDVCRAVRLVLEAPQELVSGEIFNVGQNAANYTVGEIAAAVRDLAPGCGMTLGGNGADRRSYRVDFTKISERLGLRCEWDLKRGLEDVLGVLRRASLDEEALTGARYFRLARLRQRVEAGELDGGLFRPGAVNDEMALAR